MFAKLTALVGGGYTFPYQAEEPYGTAWGQWTHYRGKSKDDGSPVSIFKISAADANDKKLVCARNGVKRLKMMRHPNLLAFKDSNEATEKGATVIQLVTEPVKPLKDVMLELGLEGQHRDEYFSMGMLHIANAVSFLNNDAKLIHGNLCMAAVVVTPGLDWKLHAFDLLSEHSLPPDNTLQEASWMVGKQYQPGELARGEWDVIRQGPPWAVDAWGLGCLTQEVFSCTEMTSVENLRHTEGIPKALLGDYQKLLSSAPARRLNPAKVAQSPFLHNRLVEVVAFMENIAVKDSVEKESFFRRLPGILPAIPAPVAVGKLLPLLASALEFGGAPPLAVSSLMVIGGHLQGDDFNKRVVPCLSKLFASSDRALRRSLLESLDQYAPHLTTGVIEDQIYPSLQTGFTDSHAYIRELTLKSILSLAPKMSNKTLVTSVLKHLSKLQVDEEPSIRANTTVLLGSIAPHLGDATCRRVLLNAFTRALKDTFPPARIAGLRALVATKQHYSAEDVAVRLLPCTTPLAMDPVPEVRAGSLACLETFTQVLKEEEEVRRAKEAAAAEAAGYMPGAQQSGGGGGGMGSMSGMGSAGSSSATSFFGAQASGMLSWAVSGLMNTVGGPAPPGAAAAGAAAPAGGAATAPKVVSPASKGPSAPAAAAAKPAAATKAGGEGWGDGDGWDEDELEIDEAELAARARLAPKTSTASTSSRPAPAPVPAGRSSGGGGSRFSAEDPAEALASAGGGWGDDADEDNVWEGMNTGAAAAPAPAAPKPAAAAAPRPAAAAAPGGAAAAAAARRAAQAAARAAGEGAGKPKLGAMKLGATKPAAPAPAPLPDTDGW